MTEPKLPLSAPSPSPAPSVRRSREITGRTVLFGLLAFFGVVITVNIVMARFAVATFGGVDTENAYQAGLAFRSEMDAAARQDLMRWTVDVAVENLGGEARSLSIRVRDAQGRPLSDLLVDARFAHPTDARQDVTSSLAAVGDGRYRAVVDARRGQWDLVIDFSEDGQRKFRSKNRVQLR